MNKCTWKDGKFEACVNLENLYAIDSNGIEMTIHNEVTESVTYNNVDFCPFCGADIRKPEPKQPTHEEIMKPKYWQYDNLNYWRMITGFRVTYGINQYLIFDRWCDRDYFIGRESADIPPEV